MTEEEKKEEPPKEEEKKEEEKSKDPGDVVKDARTKLQEENDLLEKELFRNQKLRADAMMGGKAEAGAKKEEPKKLTDVEIAEKVMKGELNPLLEDGLI